jgi:hypothetical protein
MNFCTRCGSRLNAREVCRVCSAVAYKAAHRLPVTEYPPAGHLPSFRFSYKAALLGLFERERFLTISFSYVNGALLKIRTYKDQEPAVHLEIWSQKDDPRLATSDPITGKQSQPPIRNIVRLKLGSGAERSFVLSQVRPQVKAANRVGLIFPAPVERAFSPTDDYAAIALVDYAANDCTWSTIHPDIHAIRSQLAETQDACFTDSLAIFLNGLCRRCLRLFRGRGRHAQPRHRVGVGQAELMR